MPHARQQIRNAVVAALADATDAGDQVYSGHVYSLAQMPALNVTTPEEERLGEDEGSSNTADAFALIVQVRIYAAKADGVDDALDAIAVDVHKTLLADADLAALIYDIEPVETGTELETEAAKPHGRLTMRWGVTYRTLRTDPETLA